MHKEENQIASPREVPEGESPRNTPPKQAAKPGKIKVVPRKVYNSVKNVPNQKASSLINGFVERPELRAPPIEEEKQRPPDVHMDASIKNLDNEENQSDSVSVSQSSISLRVQDRPDAVVPFVGPAIVVRREQNSSGRIFVKQPNQHQERLWNKNPERGNKSEYGLQLAYIGTGQVVPPRQPAKSGKVEHRMFERS